MAHALGPLSRASPAALRSETVVFDVAFARDAGLLLAVSNLGLIATFDLATPLSPDFWADCPPSAGAGGAEVGAPPAGEACSADAAAAAAAAAVGEGERPAKALSLGPQTIVNAGSGPLYAAQTVADRLITAGDCNIAVWDVDALLQAEHGGPAVEPLVRITPPQQSGARGLVMPVAETNALALLADGAQLAGGCGDCCAYVWDVASMSDGADCKPLRTLAGGHDGYIHAIAAVPASSLLASVGEDGLACLWDLRVEKAVAVLKEEGDAAASWLAAAAVDCDGNWLAVGGGGGVINTYHIASRTFSRSFTSDCDVHALHFDDTRLLSAGNGAAVQHWDRSSGKLLSTVPTSPGPLYTLRAAGVVEGEDSARAMAAAGASPFVDVFTTWGLRSFRFQWW